MVADIKAEAILAIVVLSSLFRDLPIEVMDSKSRSEKVALLYTSRAGTRIPRELELKGAACWIA